MNSSGLWVVIVLLLAGPLLQGQNVKISGSGNGYAGAELKIFTLTDPVTRSQKPVSRVICDNNGSFTATVPVKGSATIFIRTGIYSWYLYVTGGKEYVIRMADFVPVPPEEEQNPFFKEVRMMPMVLNDSADINNLIWKFDSEYNQAFNRIADRVAYNTKRSDIPDIIGKLNDLSNAGMPASFTDFVKFRMIMINMVGSGEYQGRIEDSVMINMKFVPDNPAYLDLIEQRFSGYFSSVLAGRLRNDLIQAISSSSLQRLKEVIIHNGFVSNGELIDYIILLNLYPAWYDGSIPQENILKLLYSMRSDENPGFISELAGNITERLLLLRQGSPAPDFLLKDESGKERSIAGLTGKYLLLSFTRSDNSAVMAEYGILNSWYKKYSEKLMVVTILCDSNFAQASARMKSAGFNWVMLDGSGQDMVEYTYNIRMYPAFVLIDPDGKIIYGSCPYPSENLEKIVAGRLIAR